MCGIVGIRGDFSRDECLEIIGRMNEAIVHRGPDDSGVWAEDGFGFGMTRLSIIDLEGGHQPMWDEPSGLGLVFNGEIYNFKAIREDLESHGATGWRTKSDTEVILKSIAHWGERGIDRFNGMFGFAAWNRNEKSLILARDRMGVKPLYYYHDGETLVFGSEIKALLASGLIPRNIDQQALWDYLTFRYVPGPQSIWKGVKKLQPGHILRVSRDAHPTEERYWRSDVRGGVQRPDADIEKEFTELFLDAVELRLVASDVPVGVFLSGGLDSSAIAAAAVELGHKAFHTFSIGFQDGGEFSELSFARSVADHIGSKHHEVLIGQEEFLEALPKMVYASDEPLADLTIIPLLKLSECARQYVKVVLSGEGSDEILGGYDLDRIEKRWQVARQLQRIPTSLLKAASAAARLTPFGTQAEKIANVPVSEWNTLDLPSMTDVFSETQKSLIWHPESKFASSRRILTEQYQSIESRDPLEQLLTIYQRSWLVEDLLMKADKATMAHSLEARTPFLDYRLVEWANSLHKSSKIRGSATKYILRKFCASRIPKAIIDRPKRGFPVPAYTWLQSDLGAWASDILLSPSSKLVGAFQRNAIESLLREAAQGQLNSQQKLWVLLILELWLREWEVEL